MGKKRLRILYIHQYFADLESATGTRSFEFARRLIAAGHQVHVITGPTHLANHRHSGDKFINPYIIRGIPATVIRVPYSNEMGFMTRVFSFILFALLSTIVVLRHKADVVFATSTPLTVAIPGIAVKLVRRVPFVFEVRDLWPEMPIASGDLTFPPLQWLARTLEWISYRAADHIVALSPDMADQIAAGGIAPNKLTVIPNACDREMFVAGKDKQSNPYADPEGRPLVVYAGAFGRINGLGYLVELAVAMCDIAPEVRFVLVGQGSEFAALEELAARRGVLGNNMLILPAIAKRDVPRLLHAATIATSIFAPLPEMTRNSANKFFDALAAGKPVAINYEGWQAALLRQSGAGLVLPPDPREAAPMLAEFLHNAARIEISVAASMNLAKQFDRDLLANRLNDVLWAVVKKRSARKKRRMPRSRQ